LCPTGQWLLVASDRLLRLFALSKGAATPISEIWLDSPILALHCNACAAAVVLAEVTHMFLIPSLLPLPEIRTGKLDVAAVHAAALSPMTKLMPPATEDTAAAYHSNPSVVAATGGQGCYFAFPQSLSDRLNRGDVVLVEACHSRSITVARAHKTAVTQIAWSGNGRCFATASSNGKNVRVFSAPNCALLFEFARGAKEALVYSIGLSQDASVVAVTSDRGTLHAFRLPAGGRGGATGSAESFASVQVKKSRCLCAVSRDGRHLAVAAPPAGDGTGSMTRVELYEIDDDKLTLVRDATVSVVA
jgi:autophagy-related protein 18